MTPPPPLFSFSTPCRRWKILVAYKGQNGWPGFLAPFATRYLNMSVKITDDQSQLRDGLGNLIGGTVTTNTYNFSIDRITGRQLATSPVGYEPFPYGIDIAADMAANPGVRWTVIDNHYVHVIPRTEAPLAGFAYTTIDVTLSNQYTPAQLDADADALIASIDPSTMPWFTAQFAQYGEINFPIGPYTPIADLTVMLPPGLIGFGLNSGGPLDVPTLGAAAWSIFTPGSVGPDNWFPNGYLKAIGYVAMAGNYCKKIITLDYAQNVTIDVCFSGRGSCADSFVVTPPPLTANQLPIAPGQDTYVTITPNCQCGS